VVVWVGNIGLLVGFQCIYWGSRFGAKAEKATQNVTLQWIYLAMFLMDAIKCQSSGRTAFSRGLKMVNGAPKVSSPSCGTTYNYEKEPKCINNGKKPCYFAILLIS
jgi:hypothetical protein